ncbi:MAG: transposon-transfer assisting family protein [Eubacterium sp.]
MNLTRDERILLMLYYSSTRPEAIRTLKEMQTCLMPDEAELWLMTESLISKLVCMTDEDYNRLETGPAGGAHADKR